MLWPLVEAGLEDAIARVTLDSQGRSVSFTWHPTHWFKEGVNSAWFEENYHLSASTSFAVRYWPLDCLPLGEGKYLVSGKGELNGETVLELWTITKPSIEVDEVTNKRIIRPGKRTSVREIRRWCEPGKDMLTRMVRKPGTETVIYGQFWSDQGALYEIDIAGPAEEDKLVAAPRKVGDVLYEPRFEWKFSDPCSYDHPEQGYVTIFVHGYESDFIVPDPPGKLRVILLIDGDRDGTLDRSLALTFDEYDEQGWHYWK